MVPLLGYRVVVIAVNLPGPLAASRLAEMGASVMKVEPPTGDPLAAEAPQWYANLTQRMSLVRLDLKAASQRQQLDSELENADVLLAAYRPAALRRLQLSWDVLEARFPRLSHVAIVGELPPHDNRPGHDLTYQAQLGLVQPSALPRLLIADFAGAQEAVVAVLGLILEFARTGQRGHVTISLKESARRFAEPLRHGLTVPTGILGGGLPGYNIYKAQDGWVALATLEISFLEEFCRLVGLSEVSCETFERIFLTRTADDWENWAATHDLPIAALK